MSNASQDQTQAEGLNGFVDKWNSLYPHSRLTASQIKLINQYANQRALELL